MVKLIKFCRCHQIEMTMRYDADSQMMVFIFTHIARGTMSNVVIKEKYDELILWSTVYEKIIIGKVIHELFELTGVSLSEE